MYKAVASIALLSACLVVGCRRNQVNHQRVVEVSKDAEVMPGQPVGKLSVVQFVNHVRRRFPQTKTFDLPAGVTAKVGVGACSVDGLDLHFGDDVSVHLSELEGHWGAFSSHFKLDWHQDGAAEMAYPGGDATMVLRRRTDSDLVGAVSFVDLRNCGREDDAGLSNEQKQAVLSLLKHAHAHAGSSLSDFCKSVECEWIDDAHARFRPIPMARFAAGGGPCGPTISFNFDGPAAPLLADLEATFGAVDPMYLRVRVKDPVGWIRNPQTKVDLRFRGAFLNDGKTYVPWIEFRDDRRCPDGGGL